MDFAGTQALAEKGREGLVLRETPAQLRDELKWAYNYNPTLRAARAELKAVQEEMPQALAGWKPQIDASGNIQSAKIDGSNFGGKGTTSKGVEVGFNQPLYRGGSTIAAVDEAENVIFAQRALLNALEQQILLDALIAYMDVVRDQALLDLSVNNEAVIAKELEATQIRFDVGELTRTDVSQAEARLAQARARRVSATGDLQSSLAVYEQIIGRPASSLMAYPDIDFPMPGSIGEAAAFAERHNPNVIAAQYIHNSAKENIDQVFGELLPHLDLFGSWNREYDPQPGLLKESTTRTVGISATIPLYAAGGTRSRVRQAKHTANQRLIEIMEVKRQVRQRALSNWEDLRAARAEIESRKAQVDAAVRAQQGVKEEAAIGTRTVLDVLDADQELLDARVALVTARRNAVVAEFSLAASLGLLTPQVLDFPSFLQQYDRHLYQINRKILGTDVDIDGESP